jgi:periodic tryptophan protein 1
MSRAKFEIEDAKESLKLAKTEAAETKVETMEEDLAKFNLEGYSDEEDLDEEDLLQAASNVDDVALGEDEYLKPDEDSEMDEEDMDDLKIRPTDNILLACRTEDDISCLEVYVYEEEDDNLYVHHDIMLPSFPLCTEWIGTALDGSAGGNFAAVGTFEPEIEIWNLDVLEIPYPTLVLGQTEKGKSKKGKKSKKSTPATNAEMHTDAVMSLSWNRLHTSFLLSGSADTTVKLWDLGQAKALRSLEHHSGKVILMVS